VNGIAASAMIGAAALFTPATPHLVMSAVLLVSGLLRSLQFTSLHAISYADVEPQETSAATSLAGVAQQVSVSLGVAIGAVVLEFSAAAQGHAAPAAGDFSLALVCVALLSSLCVALLVRLPADAGHALSGRVREDEAD
jgi:predicted MFS family arabinose efflux permease